MLLFAITAGIGLDEFAAGNALIDAGVVPIISAAASQNEGAILAGVDIGAARCRRQLVQDLRALVEVEERARLGLVGQVRRLLRGELGAALAQVLVGLLEGGERGLGLLAVHLMIELVLVALVVILLRRLLRRLAHGTCLQEVDVVVGRGHDLIELFALARVAVVAGRLSRGAVRRVPRRIFFLATRLKGAETAAGHLPHDLGLATVPHAQAVQRLITLLLSFAFFLLARASLLGLQIDQVWCF